MPIKESLSSIVSIGLTTGHIPLGQTTTVYLSDSTPLLSVCVCYRASARFGRLSYRQRLHYIPQITRITTARFTTVFSHALFAFSLALQVHRIYAANPTQLTLTAIFATHIRPQPPWTTDRHQELYCSHFDAAWVAFVAHAE